MAASSLLDVCRYNPTAGGTTDWTYSSAVTGYQSPSGAGVVNGAQYSYRAESADLSQWEVGTGTYNTGTGVLSRTTVLFNSSGTTSKINFTVAPQVAIVALAEDLLSFNGANNFTATQQGQAVANLNVKFGQCVLIKSGSNLVLLPKNGNLLTINGQACAIPAAGVSLAATGLTATTLYYIYATASAGAVSTLEASTTAHATSSTTGNVGTEIKSGDDTRTLVGMARVITGPAWADAAAQRFVRSWFNPGSVACGGSSVTTTSTSATFVEASSTGRAEFLIWSGETADFTCHGTMTDSAGANSEAAAIGIDGTATRSNECAANNSAAGVRCAFCARLTLSTLSEGYHYATPLIRTVGGGTASFNTNEGATAQGRVG